MRADTRSHDRLRLLWALVAVAGAGLTATGATSWVLIRQRLVDEHITVEGDAEHFAGARVAGPLTAFAEAEVIDRHARDASGGLAYAELGPDDPAASTVLTASFLRASLFTSVLAFGVAAFATGLGVVMLLVGAALARANRAHRGSVVSRRRSWRTRPR